MIALVNSNESENDCCLGQRIDSGRDTSWNYSTRSRNAINLIEDEIILARNSTVISNSLSKTV